MFMPSTALLLCLWLSCPRVPTSTPGFSSQLGDFTRERDALLLDPSATVDSYRELVVEHAESVAFEALSVEDLATGTFEGLFDDPVAREKAADRLQELIDDVSAAGARAHVVRLRLLGVRTVFGQPEPTVQEELVSAVLEHPGLTSLWLSPQASEILSALCTSGCSSALKEHSDRIADLLAALDPSANLDLATQLDRLVLLAALTASDVSTFGSYVDEIIAFGRGCEQSETDLAVRDEISRHVAWVDKVAARRQSIGSADLDRQAITMAELESVVAEDRVVYAQFARYLADVIYVGFEAGGELNVRMLLLQPKQDTVFSLPPSVYETPAATEFRAVDLVRSADGKVFRAFGGFRITDPAFRLSCSEIAADEKRGAGFARGLRLGGHMIDVRAEEFSIEGVEWEASDLRAGIKTLGIFLLDVSADTLRRDSCEVTHIEGIKLRILHVPAGKFGDRELEPPAEDKGEEADRGRPTKPRGSSPTIMWLRPPSIGFKEGGISFSYWNSLKFGGRYTGSLGISTTKGQSPEYQVGLNYNLLAVTNELDLFMPATALQENSLGSYYYRVGNQEPLEENSRLFERKLFVGAYTAANRLYKDAEGESQTLDTPISIGIEGGQGLGRALGARLQLAYERAHGEEIGTDTRLVITPVLGTRPVRVSRGVHLTLRGEGSTRIGDDRYTWYRGVLGATALLHPQARLSLAYFQSWEKGEPTFPYDEVPEDRGYVARFDLSHGPYKFSYMNQYSTRDDDWVRYQWWLNRTFGIAEAFVAFDEQYRQYSFGITVGIDTLYDKIARRRVLSADSGSPDRP